MADDVKYRAVFYARPQCRRCGIGPGVPQAMGEEENLAQLSCINCGHWWETAFTVSGFYVTEDGDICAD